MNHMNTLVKAKRLLAGLLLLALGYGTAYGTSLSPCGEFSFDGSPNGDGSYGVSVIIDFRFKPQDCNIECSCKKIGYIQAVRIINLENLGTASDVSGIDPFWQPNSDQHERMVLRQVEQPWLNGWAIDRIKYAVWGYYGMNDEGGFASSITPGANAPEIIPALLRDRTEIRTIGSKNVWFDAVSVPVCLDTAAECIDCQLGYYSWLYDINGGEVKGPWGEVAGDWSHGVLDLAVTEWNTDVNDYAPVKNRFPAMRRL